MLSKPICISNGSLTSGSSSDTGYMQTNPLRESRQNPLVRLNPVQSKLPCFTANFVIETDRTTVFTMYFMYIMLHKKS